MEQYSSSSDNRPAYSYQKNLYVVACKLLAFYYFMTLGGLILFSAKNAIINLVITLIGIAVCLIGNKFKGHYQIYGLFLLIFTNLQIVFVAFYLGNPIIFAMLLAVGLLSRDLLPYQAYLANTLFSIVFSFIFFSLNTGKENLIDFLLWITVFSIVSGLEAYNYVYKKRLELVCSIQKKEKGKVNGATKDNSFYQFITRLDINKRRELLSLAGILSANEYYGEALRYYASANSLYLADKILAITLTEANNTGVLPASVANVIGSLDLQQIATTPQYLYLSGRINLERGKILAAMADFEQASILYKNQNMIEVGLLADAYNLACGAIIGLNSGAKLRDFANEVLHNITMSLETKLEISIVLAFGMCLSISTTAIEIDSVLGITEKILAPAQVPELSFCKAVLFLRKDNLPKAELLLEQAIQSYLEAGNQRLRGYCLLQLGIIRHTRAAYNQSIEILNEVTSVANSDVLLTTITYFYLANSYRENGDFTKALLTYNSALQMADSLGFALLANRIRADFALCYAFQGSSKDANTLILTTKDDNYWYAFFADGCIKLSSSLDKQAIDLFEQALAIAKDRQTSHSDLARLYLLTAVAYYRCNDFDKALSHLGSCVETFAKLDFSPFLAQELAFAYSLLSFAAKNSSNDTISQFLNKFTIATSLSVTSLSNARLSLSQTKRNKTAQIKVFGLNGGKVIVGEKEFGEWRETKNRELLFFLMEYNNKVHKDNIIANLWPDLSMSAATNALHRNISFLRKNLPVKIEFKQGIYKLDGDIWYDIQDFQTSVKNNLSLNQLNAGELVESTELYHTDFRDQLDLRWGNVEKGILRSLYENGLLTLARYFTQQRDFINAITYWRRAVEANINSPLIIDAVEALISLGLHTEAKELYRFGADQLKRDGYKISDQFKTLGQRLV